MREKKGMTEEDHRRLGVALVMTREFLLRTQMDLSRKYGVTSKIVSKTARALDKVDELRSLLDSAVCKELCPSICPEGIYYAEANYIVRTEADGSCPACKLMELYEKHIG